MLLIRQTRNGSLSLLIQMIGMVRTIVSILMPTQEKLFFTNNLNGRVNCKVKNMT